MNGEICLIFPKNIKHSINYGKGSLDLFSVVPWHSFNLLIYLSLCNTFQLSSFRTLDCSQKSVLTACPPLAGESVSPNGLPACLPIYLLVWLFCQSRALCWITGEFSGAPYTPEEYNLWLCETHKYVYSAVCVAEQRLRWCSEWYTQHNKVAVLYYQEYIIW